jgi:hypothetical protein
MFETLHPRWSSEPSGGKSEQSQYTYDRHVNQTFALIGASAKLSRYRPEELSDIRQARISAQSTINLKSSTQESGNGSYLEVEVPENFDESFLEARNLKAILDPPNKPLRVKLNSNVFQ